MLKSKLASGLTAAFFGATILSGLCILSFAAPIAHAQPFQGCQQMSNSFGATPNNFKSKLNNTQEKQWIANKCKTTPCAYAPTCVAPKPPPKPAPVKPAPAPVQAAPAPVKPAPVIAPAPAPAPVQTIAPKPIPGASDPAYLAKTGCVDVLDPSGRYYQSIKCPPSPQSSTAITPNPVMAAPNPVNASIAQLGQPQSAAPAPVKAADSFMGCQKMSDTLGVTYGVTKGQATAAQHQQFIDNRCTTRFQAPAGAPVKAPAPPPAPVVFTCANNPTSKQCADETLVKMVAEGIKKVDLHEKNTVLQIDKDRQAMLIKIKKEEKNNDMMGRRMASVNEIATRETTNLYLLSEQRRKCFKTEKRSNCFERP